MECCEVLRRAAAVLVLPTIMGSLCQAQSPYRMGYPPAGYIYRAPRNVGTPRGAQTVTDYRPLIRAITSLPGWNQPPSHSNRRGTRLPSLPRAELLGARGEVLWPAATPRNSRLLAANQDVERAVALVVSEHDKYGEASIRLVADARNKLTEFARQSLPSLKARDRTAADQLEKFIVELQKTLATLTVNY
jgi:hypothetical protein